MKRRRTSCLKTKSLSEILLLLPTLKDHGKSTLADRIMETTNTVSNREARDQLLPDDLSC